MLASTTSRGRSGPSTAGRATRCSPSSTASSTSASSATGLWWWPSLAPMWPCSRSCSTAAGRTACGTCVSWSRRSCGGWSRPSTRPPSPRSSPPTRAPSPLTSTRLLWPRMQWTMGWSSELGARWWRFGWRRREASPSSPSTGSQRPWPRASVGAPSPPLSWAPVRPSARRRCWLRRRARAKTRTCPGGRRRRRRCCSRWRSSRGGWAHPASAAGSATLPAQARKWVAWWRASKSEHGLWSTQQARPPTPSRPWWATTRSGSSRGWASTSCCTRTRAPRRGTFSSPRPTRTLARAAWFSPRCGAT
mmetsp:Transcript_7002/g.22973  ORF Transcript_7002/g.22973 Transcript_7002/m.22973 type:complete len:305 (+) Transcript_7002:2504-3418(+)